MSRGRQICLLGALLLALPVQAVTKTWTGANNNEWGTGTNWNPNGVPGSSDDVVINLNRTVRLSAGIAAVAASVSIGGAVTLDDRGSGSTLTVGGAISVTPNANVTLNIRFTAGSLSKSGTGTLTLTRADAVSGALSLSTGTLTAQSTLGAGSITMTGGTLTAQGDLTVTGAVGVSGTGGARPGQ